MSGWYKQQRDLPEREWFKEPHLVQLYIALKSLAYVSDGRYEGCLIRRGSYPTTRAELSELTGMKRMTLDRCLKKLISLGEIIVKANNRFSVVTICDYDGFGMSESLFRATDGITDGNTNGIASGNTDGNTHLLTIEERYKDNLISPSSPYKNERESEDLALEVKNLYNKTFDGVLPPCIRLSTATRIMVNTCLRRFGRQAVDMVFEQIKTEQFSLGNNRTGFQANFTFIFKPSEFQKYLERAKLAKRKKETATQQPQQKSIEFDVEEPSAKETPQEYEQRVRKDAADGKQYALRIVKIWDGEKRIPNQTNL